MRPFEVQTSALTFAPASWAGHPAGALWTPGRLPPDELSPKVDGGVRKRNLVAALGAYLALQPPTPSADGKLTPHELMRMPWRVPRVLSAPSASKKWSSPAEGPGDAPGPRDGKSASPPPRASGVFLDPSRGGLCTPGPRGPPSPRLPPGCSQAQREEASCPEAATPSWGACPSGRGLSPLKPSAVAQLHGSAEDGETRGRPRPPACAARSVLQIESQGFGPAGLLLSRTSPLPWSDAAQIPGSPCSHPKPSETAGAPCGPQRGARSAGGSQSRRGGPAVLLPGAPRGSQGRGRVLLLPGAPRGLPLPGAGARGPGLLLRQQPLSESSSTSGQLRRAATSPKIPKRQHPA